MKRTINFLTGFTIGVALGGMLTTLFAPDSGSGTREQFRARLQRVLDEASRAAEEAKAEAMIRMAELKAKQED